MQTHCVYFPRSRSAGDPPSHIGDCFLWDVHSHQYLGVSHIAIEAGGCCWTRLRVLRVEDLEDVICTLY